MTVVTFRTVSSSPHLTKSDGIRSGSGEPQRVAMTEPFSGRDAQRVHLKSLARKALADAWARGLNQPRADAAAAQVLHERFPNIPEREILDFIQSIRQDSG